MSRLIAVSNRVAAPSGGKSAGGLAVGILAALKQSGGIWFGWGGKTCHGEPTEPKLDRHGEITFATIDINETEFDGYYNGYCNSTLWPLCHYMLGIFGYEREQHEAYRRVNETFARKLRPLLQEDDRIWVHDYHLIPLAEELRSAGVRQPIGFFLHVPFPAFDILRTLPGYHRLLRSLAQYDVIGFQTEQDCENFLAGLRAAGLGGERGPDGRVSALQRRIRVDAYPISIDVEEAMTQAAASMKTSAVQRLAKDIDERELVIGVDRLDYSKGLPERFQAFQALLERHPASHRHLVFLQIASPTRSGVRAYEEIRHVLEQSAGHINGRFSQPDWTPIRYINRGISRKMLMGYFRLAKIGLVTPLRDGMNLVAKEYVAAQDPADPGVLVLSRLAGAAAEFGESALLVNPYDAIGVADAILTASEMSLEERQDRYRAMMDVLQGNDIHAWRQRFLDALGV
ncbi:trehalose-6-phosphate synthase [Wenzhouxiangella sp. XN24]|uniref:alpha,alpha-trehalose-phosphate synthase (UDP-forming) n=1 Tax=Wenzhouxiangella sp. XN24 TaxID=2713569 RepID=UPI0013E9CCF1|nr:trehalose-6-phosphate synthase [Wenzhouxiangella sp. XN24]NGX15087.1 trehalose-6-phosphate synthase [Wenzhouxiangella sp. XN24]